MITSGCWTGVGPLTAANSMTVTAGVATTAGTPVQSGDLAARALADIDRRWRESILRCYEQIRQQAAADLVTENRIRLVGGEAVSKGQSVCGWRSTGGDFGVIRLSGAISLRFAGP